MCGIIPAHNYGAMNKVWMVGKPVGLTRYKSLEFLQNELTCFVKAPFSFRKKSESYPCLTFTVKE